jgi:hypothetical protein
MLTETKFVIDTILSPVFELRLRLNLGDIAIDGLFAIFDSGIRLVSCFDLSKARHCIATVELGLAA